MRERDTEGAAHAPRSSPVSPTGRVSLRVPGRAAWLVALVLSTASCGYRVVRGDAPFGVRRLAVLPFQEDAQVGISGPLTEELSALLASGGVRLTMDESSAGGVLSGTVVAATSRALPVKSSGDAIPGYQVAVTVDVWLKAPDGAVLWKTRVRHDESFLPSSSGGNTEALETEANRRRALRRTAEALARTIHERLLLASSVSPGG